MAPVLIRRLKRVAYSDKMYKHTVSTHQLCDDRQHKHRISIVATCCRYIHDVNQAEMFGSVDDMCRLCGTDTSILWRKTIFAGKGLRSQYALKISECLFLQVSIEPFLDHIFFKIIVQFLSTILFSLNSFKSYFMKNKNFLHIYRFPRTKFMILGNITSLI